MKKKNTTTKLMALIALSAIIIGIVGTGVLVILQTINPPEYETEISAEELQQYVESLSGSIDSEDGLPDFQNGENITE